MSRAATFIPPKEHLGSFAKTRYGDVNAAEHLGFTQSYEAVYASGQALVEAVVPVYEKAYYWKSASFFTGIDANLGNYITPFRDIGTAILTGLELIKSVLGILDTLTSLGINLLKVIVDRVVALLVDVLNLLNPEGSLHALVIPPKVGNPGVSYDYSINDEDSQVEKAAKVSEQTRQDFIRYTNTIAGRIPGPIGSKVSDYVSQQANQVSGSNYLLSVISNKLKDTRDIARPDLKEYSYSAGVGLFVGTSALNQFLDVWGKINSIFGKDLDLHKMGFRNLPPIPKIVANRLPQVNVLAYNRTLDSVDESSITATAIQARPVAPREFNVKGDIPYKFVKRLFLLSKKVTSSSYTKAIVTKELNDFLDSSEAIQVLADIGATDTLSSYATMEILNNSYVTRRTLNHPERLEPGTYFVVATDIYSIPAKDIAKFVHLSSEVSEFTIPEDPKQTFGFAGLVQGRLPTSLSELVIDNQATSPNWVAAPVSLQLLPTVVGNIVEFVTSLRVVLTSLLDDALDWIHELLENLSTIISAYQAILAKIDAILELLQLLSSLTASLGVSVMSFYGSGDSATLYTMFSEYLDPKVSSTTNLGEPTQRDITYSNVLSEDTRLRQWSLEQQQGLLGESIVRSGPSYLDSTGTISVSGGARRLVQDEELQAILGERDPNATAISAAWKSSYNMSPIFTDEMTTGGVILMGHSYLEKNLAALRTLIELLFGSDEPATVGNQETLLNEVGLYTDLPDLTPSIGLENTLSDDTQALFTRDMKLTQDPDQSPFDFCPPD